MASVHEPLSKSPFSNGPHNFAPQLAKSIPILPSSAASQPNSDDPMDLSQNQTTPMGPPTLSSPGGDRENEQTPPAQNDQQQNAVNGGSNQPVGANVAAQQPKVVQTAFIHKLYK